MPFWYSFLCSLIFYLLDSLRALYAENREHRITSDHNNRGVSWLYINCPLRSILLVWFAESTPHGLIYGRGYHFLQNISISLLCVWWSFYLLIFVPRRCYKCCSCERIRSKRRWLFNSMSVSLGLVDLNVLWFYLFESHTKDYELWGEIVSPRYLDRSPRNIMEHWYQ